MKKHYQYLITFSIAFILLFTVETNAQIFTLKGTQVNHVDEKTSSTNKSAESKLLSKTFKRYDVFKMNVKDLDVYVKSNGGTATFALDLGESYQWQMKIEPVDIFSPNAKAYELTENGQVEIALPRNILFKGIVNGKKSDQVRLTINDDKIAGLVIINDEKYYIESLQNIEKTSDESHYIVYKANDVVERPDLICQAAKDSHTDEDVQKKAETNKTTAKCSGQVENQIATYATYRRYSAAGGSTQVNNEILTILNNVQANYNEYNLKLVVTEQKVSTCTTCDPWGDKDYSIRSLLDGFTSWAPTGFQNTHDQGLCFFDGPGSGTVGLAWVGTICTANRYAACDKLASSSQDRVLVAHEMGHNFGAGHDAAGSGFIMAPSVNAANTWSSQSKNSINGHIESRNCLNCTTGTPPPPPPPTGCNAPTGLSVENLAATTATLKWNAVTSATGYIVELKTINQTNWSSFNSSGSSLSLSSFETGVTYQWRVKTSCSDSSNSATTNGSNFTPGGTTPPPNTCTTPASASASNITSTSATINWSSAGAPSYSIYVAPAGGTRYLAASGLTGTSYNLSGLSANKSYTIDVYSICAAGSLGRRFTFTTLSNSSSNSSACVSPTNTRIITQSAGSVQLGWNAVSGASTYTLQLKSTTSSNWSVFRTNGTSINFSGLQQGVIYQWRVSTTCTNGVSSYTDGPDISGYATSAAEFSVTEDLEDLKVYPNPSNNNFTLQIENTTAQFADVVVTNTAGKVVYKASKIDVKVPLVFGDQFPAGVYIVKLVTADKTAVAKVIKQ